MALVQTLLVASQSYGENALESGIWDPAIGCQLGLPAWPPQALSA